MFKHRKFGQWIFIDTVYKVREDIFLEWCKDEAIQEKIEQFMETKKTFAEETKEIFSNTQFRAFATDSLMLYELKTGRDICMASLEEMREVVKQGMATNNFRSISSSTNYSLLFSKITEWAYHRRYRNDFYNKSDFGIQEEEYLGDAEVYTPSEMAKIFDNIEKEDVYICMMGSLEGLTNTEILNIKRSNFKRINENVPIDVGTRMVNVSDQLYQAMYDYAQVESIERVFNGGMMREVSLNDSEMLIRAIKTTRSQEIVKATTLCVNIKKQMKDMGYENLTATTARSYSMYYDLLKGMSIEEFNHKYGTKFQHPKVVMKNKEIAAKMREKINREIN